MVFCRCCGKEIHETASACPHCGGLQQITAHLPHTTTDYLILVPIASLVLGIISMLAFLDDSQWDKKTILGLATFSVNGVFLGIISISKLKTGKGMAITGVVLSSIALLMCIGLLFE